MTWISVKEAAALFGYSEDYFRRTFCAPGAPLVTLMERRGKAGHRRILVLKASVLELVQIHIKTPA